jgi:hypothetical protein
MYNHFNPDTERIAHTREKDIKIRVEKWKGKVLGGEMDIKDALERLGRDPKDLQELQKIIFQIRKEGVEATTADSLKSFY